MIAVKVYNVPMAFRHVLFGMSLQALDIASRTIHPSLRRSLNSFADSAFDLARDIEDVDGPPMGDRCGLEIDGLRWVFECQVGRFVEVSINIREVFDMSSLASMTAALAEVGAVVARFSGLASVLVGAVRDVHEHISNMHVEAVSVGRPQPSVPSPSGSSLPETLRFLQVLSDQTEQPRLASAARDGLAAWAELQSLVAELGAHIESVRGSGMVDKHNATE